MMKTLALFAVLFSSYVINSYAGSYLASNVASVDSLSADNTSKSKPHLFFKEHYPAVLEVSINDTPDDVARIFLKNPWRWPEAWGGQPAPKQLLPGDKIKVEKSQGMPFLVHIPATSDGEEVTVKLGPRIIATPIQKETTISDAATVPFHQISTFMSKGRIFDDSTVLAALPNVISNEDGYYLQGFPGDTLYAEAHSSIKPGITLNIYRQNTVYIDPNTQRFLGVGAHYVGQANVDGQENQLVRLKVKQAQREIRTGDVLVPVAKAIDRSDFLLSTWKSHSQVIAPIHPTDLSGEYASVVIYGGKQQGIQRGQLFSVYNPPTVLDDGNEKVRFKADHPIGEVMVYRTFTHLSYAIILNASEPIESGDVLKPPAS